MVAGKQIAGPLVRLACERHLDDLKHAAKRGLEWKPSAAVHVIGFFAEVLKLPDGEKAGTPFKLEAHQAFIIGSLFGWKEKKTGYRRFRIAYIEEGKGNGKSPLAAGVGLYMTTSDQEPGAEVYAAAVTREQANIMYQDAVKMRATSPQLVKHLRPSGIKPVYNLADFSSGSFFRPVSAEGRGLDGKRVHCAIIDEVHEHPTEIVVEKMRAGTKGRTQALIFMITNSGYDRQSVCWHWHEFGRRSLEGEIHDRSEFDHCFFFICSLDPGDEWTDPKVWKKANPNLGVSITTKYLQEQVKEALAMPSKQGIVRRLNFCEWTESHSPWISRPVWDACLADLELGDYEGEECHAGLDLSMARDLTALTLVFPRGDRHFKLFGFFWTPADTLQDRAEKDRAPYGLWVEQGHLIATPGKVVNYAWVAQQLVELSERFDLRTVAFDEYRIPLLEQELSEIGAVIPLTKHPQGFRRAASSLLWMPQSINELENAIIERRIEIQNNPVMSWCAASAVLETDAQGNRKFAKQKATGRIDGVVAGAMAMGAATVQQENNDVQMFFMG